MTIGEHFLVAGIGYPLGILLLALGVRCKNQARRLSILLRVLAGIVTVITTLSWLWPAATSGGALGGLFMFLLLFVFVPVVVTYVGQRLAARWKGAESFGLNLFVGICGLALLVPGMWLLATGTFHLIGLAHHVDLTITGIGTTSGRRPATVVSGDYLLNGQLHHLSRSTWLKFGPHPVRGQVYPVTISLLWPTMMIESLETAWAVTVFGLGLAVLGGYILTRGFERTEKKKSPDHRRT